MWFVRWQVYRLVVGCLVAASHDWFVCAFVGAVSFEASPALEKATCHTCHGPYPRDPRVQRLPNVPVDVPAGSVDDHT